MKVFLFPGQGSQEIGMGADLFKSDSSFRQLIELASGWVGEDLEPICLRGPEKKLLRARLLQPLLVAVSLGYLRRLNESGVQPDLVLGHSLGEITALAAAGVVTPTEAVRIAARRGELMEEAAASVDGGMLAVTLNERGRLLDWITSIQADHQMALANDNAPTQLVLSGSRAALAACAEFISKEKLGKSRLLAVSGPWHSPFMTQAATCFEAWLRQLPLQPPRLPILFNGTAAPTEDTAEICRLIGSAPARPVQWTGCMAAVRAMNPRWLFEVGPGRVVSGLARANGIGDQARIFPCGNLRGVELAAQALFAVAPEPCPVTSPLLRSGL